jgi:hypothetical protein
MSNLLISYVSECINYMDNLGIKFKTTISLIDENIIKYIFLVCMKLVLCFL